MTTETDPDEPHRPRRPEHSGGGGNREVRPCRSSAAEHPVSRATPSDVPATVAVLAAAFADYPWTRWTVQSQDHAARVRGLFELTVAEVGVPYGDVWVSRCPYLDGTVVAAAVALRPDRPVPPYVWEGLSAREAELLGTRRTAAEQAEQICAPLRPADPHLIVATLGVRPDHQRRGLATALMRPLLDVADDLQSPTHLETSTEANVALYSRLGFTVTGHTTVNGDGPPVWAMRRPSGGAATRTGASTSLG